MTKKYLSSAQVRERYGNVSHMWLTRKLVSDGTFPRPTKLGSGRLNFWDETELEAWEQVQRRTPSNLPARP